MKSIERFFTEFKSTITVILGIFVVVGFFIGADNYIGNEIERKITDESYINKLARVLRPFAIFDKNGAIQYDHGAERYIQQIEVQEPKRGDLDLVMTTKEFLKNPPILIHIGYENFAYVSERIGTYKWKFKLRSDDVIMSEKAREGIDPIFIVEITK